MSKMGDRLDILGLGTAYALWVGGLELLEEGG